MTTSSPVCDPRDIHPGLGAYGSIAPTLSVGAGMVLSSAGNWQNLQLDLSGNKDFMDMKSRVEEIEKRLAILNPNEELQKRFPALQEAYDHYKLIEKLVNDKK